MGEESSTSDGLDQTNYIDNSSKSLYTATLSDEFLHFYDNVFSDEKLDLIDDFLEHYETHGLNNWKGKISPSWKVPECYKDHERRAKYAQDMNLWHAHIGLPSWQSRENIPYLTSNQVLHFQKLSRYEIFVLSVSTHNPMDLPEID
ncbi:hypothetical protein [Acinetobacter oleivorans]|uniref:hypothetical protein n=1 Tax=Acinetobacter oleivorans TaxID=1148157 RepID=UPI00124FE7E6|nr:hypothetical protein [Acinetobacter oleivorans]